MDLLLNNIVNHKKKIDDIAISNYIVLLYILRAINISLKGSIELNISLNVVFNLFYVVIHLILLFFIFLKLQDKDKILFSSIYCIVIFYILINLILNQDFFYNIIEKNMWLLIADIPIIFLLTKLEDLEIFYKIFLKKSIYISIACILLYYFHISNLSSNMVFAYTLLVPLLMHIHEAVSRQKIAYILISIYELSILLAYGSRGSLIVLAVYLFLYIFLILFKKLTKKQFIKLILFLSLILILSVISLPYIYDTLSNSGVYIRNLDFLMNGKFFTSNQRIEIYKNFFTYISQKPFFGWGLAGEFIVGEFPHNFIVEILFNFGLIIGSCIIMSILYLIIRPILKSSFNKKIFIVFFSTGIIPLLLSSSYIEWLPFWTFLGICLSEFNSKKHKKKILFVFNQLGIGGAAKSLAFVANSCYDAKYDVKVITYSSSKKTVNINSEIPISVLNYEATEEIKKNKISRIINKIKLLIKLRENISSYNPDLIIVFMSNIVSAVVLSDVFLSNNIISSERGNPKRYKKSRLFVYSFFYNQCKSFIVQTNDSFNYFRKLIYRKIVKIPNYCESVVLEKKVRRNKNILAVGRFSKEKGYNYLIDAFSKLIKDHPEYKLKIYGDNEDDSSLIIQINSLNLNNNIEIIKGCTNVFEKEYNSAMFVLPSLEEGMPNVLMEAMANKIPAIATDCDIGGPKELLGNKGGILVPIKNSDALYSAMKKYVENPDYAEACAENSFERIKEYSADKIKTVWLDTIEEASNE